MNDKPVVESGPQPIENTFFNLDQPEYEVIDIFANKSKLKVPDVKVGTYNENQGVVIFNDGTGAKLARMSDSIRSMVDANKWTQESYWLPFTNGEVPVDEATCQKLSDALGFPQMMKDRELRVAGAATAKAM